MTAQDRRIRPLTDPIETRIQYRAGEQLFAFLALRAMRMGTSSPDIQARVEVEIWRAVMAAELRRIPLTLAEATCLASVLKGHPPARGPVSSSIPVCYAECQQVFELAAETPGETTYGTRYGMSEDTLLTKLRRLGPAADLALEDALARWHAHNPQDPTPDGFARAGLRIIPEPPDGNSGGPAGRQG
jgi:hypothetical protein